MHAPLDALSTLKEKKIGWDTFLKIHSRKCMLWILSPAYTVLIFSLGYPKLSVLSSKQLCQGHSRDCNPADGIESSSLCAYASFFIFFSLVYVLRPASLPPPNPSSSFRLLFFNSFHCSRDAFCETLLATCSD